MKKLIGLVGAVAVMVCLAGQSFAVSTNDQTVGTSVSAGLKTPVVLVGYANFCPTAVAGYPGGVTAGAADVYKAVTIPANFYVQRVAITTDVKEPNTNTVTVTVGDSALVTQYLGATSVTNAVGTVTVSATTSNKFYSTADFISVIPNAVAGTGRVKVQVEGTQF